MALALAAGDGREGNHPFPQFPELSVISATYVIRMYIYMYNIYIYPGDELSRFLSRLARFSALIRRGIKSKGKFTLLLQ